jgi:hypothetical protein
VLPAFQPPPLPTCWPPSPCARLSRARTTTGPPSPPVPSADDGPIRTVQLGAGGWERHEMVPVFDSESIDQLGTQLCPGSIATTTPQTFIVAFSPTRQAGYEVGRSSTRNGRALHPGPYPPDLSRRLAYGALTTGSCRIPSDLARQTRPVWQYQAVPALSALLSTLPVVSRIRLRSASIGLLRQPNEKVFHLLQLRAPHGAPAPRGALEQVAGQDRVRLGP